MCPDSRVTLAEVRVHDVRLSFIVVYRACYSLAFEIFESNVTIMFRVFTRRCDCVSAVAILRSVGDLKRTGCATALRPLAEGEHFCFRPQAVEEEDEKFDGVSAGRDRESVPLHPTPLPQIFERKRRTEITD